MYNEELNDESIDKEIQRYADRIKTLEELKEKIKGVAFYECGIRKRDHKIAHFTFLLNGVEAMVEVKLPQMGESYRIGLEDFANDYVPYSQKTRAILPKRNKR
jgi:hypothetical protein